MALFVDARIPVVFAAAANAAWDDAVLAETAADAPSPAAGHRARFSVAEAADHKSGCACCTPRSGAAAALGRLFLDRARGDIPFFRRVVVTTTTLQGAAAVRAAVAQDPLVSGRFRLG
jgi:G3E family GTPase